jgi:flagellar hook-basal body complex protein FliE
MTIPAIPAISGLSGITSTTPLGPAAGTEPSSGAAASSGTGFASVLNKGIESLQSTQNTADSLAVQAATGDLTDISRYTVAATQASLATDLAATLRTKAVDSFNEIMGMQA